MVLFYVFSFFASCNKGACVWFLLSTISFRVVQAISSIAFHDVFVASFTVLVYRLAFRFAESSFLELERGRPCLPAVTVRARGDYVFRGRVPASTEWPQMVVFYFPRVVSPVVCLFDESSLAKEAFCIVDPEFYFGFYVP